MKLSIFFSVFLFFLCLFALFFNTQVIFFDMSAFGVLIIMLLTSFLVYQDISFGNNGETSLITGDTFFTIEEKTIMYNTRGYVFLPSLSLQFFLLFCFDELVKCLLSSIIFVVFYGVAIFLSMLKIRPLVISRQNQEIEELRRQLQNEELGKYK